MSEWREAAWGRLYAVVGNWLDEYKEEILKWMDAEAALRAETPTPTEGIEGMLARAVALAEIREILTKSTIERWRAALFAKAAETPAPRETKLTISDLDEILGGYDSAHVTRGTVLQRLNEWLRIRAAGEPEQAK